jgi:transposase-like protein
MGPGWWFCGDCKDKFTVRVGSVFERSHIPLHKWLLGFRLMASSKKGVSAHQLHRTLEISYKSAWFMAHRIREAMSDDEPTAMGGEGRPLEVDEAYIGPPGYELKTHAAGSRWQKKRGHGDKMKVVTLVERGGRARSVKVDNVTAETLANVIARNANPASRLMTDESTSYNKAGSKMASHETVHHKRKEFVRGDVHTNTVEGYFSIFKRGMKGIYQHCGENHLHRYLHEFDFRYSNRAKLGIDDGERTALAIKGAEGKRLSCASVNRLIESASRSKCTKSVVRSWTLRIASRYGHALRRFGKSCAKIGVDDCISPTARTTTAASEGIVDTGPSKGRCENVYSLPDLPRKIRVTIS